MPQLAAILHQINPYAIKLWEGGPIRWYGLSYLAGFLLSYFVIRRVVTAGRSTLKKEEVADLVATLAIGAVVGGRLGYALFYQPELLWTAMGSPPWWGLLAINQGGMASHGGMLGIIVAAWWFARRRQQRMTHLMDLAAFAAPPGLLLGRIANFVNGELYGRPCALDLPWAVQFPQEAYHWDKALIAEMARELPPPASIADGGVNDYVAWFIHQVQQGNTQAVTIARTWLTPRHPSQLYEALLEGLVLMLVLALVWMKPRRPLVVTSWFAIVYAVVRVIGEQFRQPDAPIGYQALGLTRGQWLSLALLALGVGLLIVSRRLHAEPMGGWRRTTA